MSVVDFWSEAFSFASSSLCFACSSSIFPCREADLATFSFSPRSSSFKLPFSFLSCSSSALLASSWASDFSRLVWYFSRLLLYLSISLLQRFSSPELFFSSSLRPPISASSLLVLAECCDMLARCWSLSVLTSTCSFSIVCCCSNTFWSRKSTSSALKEPSISLSMAARYFSLSLAAFSMCNSDSSCSVRPCNVFASPCSWKFSSLRVFRFPSRLLHFSRRVARSASRRRFRCCILRKASTTSEGERQSGMHNLSETSQSCSLSFSAISFDSLAVDCMSFDSRRLHRELASSASNLIDRRLTSSFWNSAAFAASALSCNSCRRRCFARISPSLT
mmetsp:Transcript_15593/g.35692  ORF Transcript_15593/g.35692 Transcript_15593/m.35692 type:complete len:334 (-) Transcript_15593:942-1943(-)